MPIGRTSYILDTGTGTIFGGAFPVFLPVLALLRYLNEVTHCNWMTVQRCFI